MLFTGVAIPPHVGSGLKWLQGGQVGVIPLGDMAEPRLHLPTRQHCKEWGWRILIAELWPSLLSGKAQAPNSSPAFPSCPATLRDLCEVGKWQRGYLMSGKEKQLVIGCFRPMRLLRLSGFL